MIVELVAQAIGMFAVTNIDDIVVLSLYFGRARRFDGGARRVVVGQFLGFGAIVVVSVAGALGARLLPESAVAYLGLLPIALGVRAGYEVWRDRGRDPEVDDTDPDGRGPSALHVAGVTFANGGDNIGLYVPVFATAGLAAMAVYVSTFLVMVAVWCAAGLFVATRPVVARALDRWGHLILPVVLIALGVAILVEGGAFGL